MKETASTSTDCPFDLAALLERVDNDRELLRDLLSIFKEDFPRHLQALREAAESGDMKNLSAVCHTLKGMLSSMSACRAAAAAAELEQLGRTGESTSVRAAMQLFESEVSELLPRLDVCLAEVCS